LSACNYIHVTGMQDDIVIAEELINNVKVVVVLKY
jgi:hypothetical protein